MLLLALILIGAIHVLCNAFQGSGAASTAMAVSLFLKKKKLNSKQVNSKASP